MFKHILTLHCCLLLAYATRSQAQHLRFTSLSVKDGLLSNSVNAITKDHIGLMWFGTADGLNKFDGTNFTVFRHIPGDSASLRVNDILALHEDKNHNMWVGTSGGGLSRYDHRKGTFVHYPLNGTTPELPANAVIRDICSDHKGQVWIAQYEHLFVLDPATHHITRRVLARDAAGREVSTILLCVMEDSRHRIWAGTTQGIYVCDGTSSDFRGFTHSNTDAFSLPGNDVRAVTEDSDGRIWIATGAGLCTFREDGSGFTRYPGLHGSSNVLSSNEINSIKCDKDGQLWVGTAEGLDILNTRTLQVSNYAPEDGNIHSLTSRSISNIYIDRQGIYWLGTLRGGVNKYDKNLNLFDLKLNTAFQENRRVASVVSAFAENSNGNVFVGTDGGGLFEFNRRNNQISPVPIQLPGKNGRALSILAMHRTKENELYIGTYTQGLVVLNTDTRAMRQFTKAPGYPGGNDIFCIKEDSRGNIWVGTNGQGIDVYRKQQVVTRYTPTPRAGAADEQLLPFNGFIRTIEEDKDGNIWIGSHGGGIAMLNTASQKWTIYTQTNSRLPSDKIQVLLCDRRGDMWVGTYGEGLSLFDKKTKQFITFSEKDGLQNTTIYQIVEDRNGLLWLSTNTGISSFDAPARRFRNYTHHNGLQNTNFVHTAGMQLADGELIFGGLQGFNHFHPAELTINRNVPTVVLTELRVANKVVVAGEDAPLQEDISIAGAIRLAYKQNFSLSFVALNYTIPRQNSYAYKLEGFDKDWNYTGAANTASYTNLDPGEYTFHVKACNNDGVWSTKDTTIKISVRPPFWRTTYAYLLYFLLAAGLLLYSRYRSIARIRKKFLLEQEQQEIKRMQELDRMKMKFLTNLSHDFRTPISLIMGPVEQLIASEKTDMRLDKLYMVKRNARRLLNLVNQLLDFKKMEEHELQLQLSSGDMVLFIKEVTDSFQDFAERKRIHFHFTPGMPSLPVQFDQDKMERILFNLLSNAFKFTLEGGSVTVALQATEHTDSSGRQCVTITVSDTGVGIPRDKQEQIFQRFFQTGTTAAILNQGSGIGLSIAKEFIKLHNGSIEVVSEPGKGAAFIIQLPLIPAVIQPAATAGEAPDTPALEIDTPAIATLPVNAADMPLVLLVEDNEDFRSYLRDYLRQYYKVLEASNGKEGWQKALANHPQLIVSDISMPQMDGIELVQKLKADKRTAHIPVILLTAQTAEEQEIAGLETGANDYITKPFNTDVLHVKIRNLLKLNNTLKSTYSRQIKVVPTEITIASPDEVLLNKATRYLEENLTNSQLSVENLSRELGMSRTSLYNKILEITGQTPVEYIRSYRLQKAAQLMEKSDMTIAEIAYEVGFSSPNYFARSFRTQFNMLPSEYVAKRRKV